MSDIQRINGRQVVWTEAMIEQLRVMSEQPGISYGKMGAAMGIARNSCARMCRLHGFKEPATVAFVAEQGWSDGEVETLRRLWPDHPRKLIAAEMGRTIGSIDNKAFAEGLTARIVRLTPEQRRPGATKRRQKHRRRVAESRNSGLPAGDRSSTGSSAAGGSPAMHREPYREVFWHVADAFADKYGFSHRDHGFDLKRLNAFRLEHGLAPFKIRPTLGGRAVLGMVIHT